MSELRVWITTDAGAEAIIVVAMSTYGGQFDTNCSTSFTIGQLKVLNLTRGVTAVTCAVVVLFIILLLVCQRAFSSTFQRLYLYLLIVTFLIEVLITLSLERQFEYNHQDEVCVLLGFTTQWLSVIQMIYTFEMILYLFCLVIFAIHKNCFPQFQQSKLCKGLTEALLVLVPILLAFAYTWEPYIFGNRYGLAGPFCWIRSVDDQCQHVGTRDQMIYYGLYEILGITGILAHIIFAVVYCRLAASLKEARHLLRQTLIVMVFQFVYTLTITFQLGVRLYTGLNKHQTPHYAVWQTFSFVSPFRQLLFPVGCLVCFYPIKAMVVECYRQKLCKCRCCKRSSTSYEDIGNPDITTARRATVPPSTRISQPSDTFFVVPHPDDPLTTYTGESSHLFSQERIT